MVSCEEERRREERADLLVSQSCSAWCTCRSSRGMLVRRVCPEYRLDLTNVAGEIGALAGSSEVGSRGVDSVGSGFKNPATIVRDLARRESALASPKLLFLAVDIPFAQSSWSQCLAW